MIKRIGVLGAGQMGSGIAHVFAQFAFSVTLYDIAEAQLQKAVATIGQNLERQAKKGAISAVIGGRNCRTNQSNPEHARADRGRLCD